MGSKTFDGVRFAVFSHDHEPPYIHGNYAGIVVIVELNDGRVRLAARKDRVKPASAKRADVAHVLRTARNNADELLKLWEALHG